MLQAGLKLAGYTLTYSDGSSGIAFPQLDEIEQQDTVPQYIHPEMPSPIINALANRICMVSEHTHIMDSPRLLYRRVPHTRRSSTKGGGGGFLAMSWQVTLPLHFMAYVKPTVLERYYEGERRH